MISAMPAVAIRRERSKSVDRLPAAPPTRRSRFVEYYHRKISRMSSIRPSTRTYSTATTPDAEAPLPLPGDLLVTVDGERRRLGSRWWPARLLGLGALFHVGCVLIGAGLIVLFLSMATIKADVITMRALGSFLVALGALLCLLRTIFFKKPEPHRHVLHLRSSDSFTARGATPATAPPASPGGSVGSVSPHRPPSDDQERFL